MRTWARAPLGTHERCGQCGAAIPAGAPLLRITLPAVVRALRRCEACAGPAPPDLPPLPVVAPPPPVAWTPAFTPTARIAAFDWRARAAGREPGEEG
jgi:hypothetical protein